MLVTVITPTYNCAATLVRCLRSVATQSCSAEIEHIIVDGGSTDETVEILKSHGVRYISEPDAGVYHAMNKGILLARGDYIHILNADDCYVNAGSLNQLLSALEANGADMAHGYAEIVDAEERALWRIGGVPTRVSLLKKMVVAHPTCVLRASVYSRYGTYSPGFRIAADQEFMLRIHSKIRSVFVDEVLVKMQVGGLSSSNVIGSSRESYAAAIIHGQGVLKGLWSLYCFVIKSYIFRFLTRIGLLKLLQNVAR